MRYNGLGSSGLKVSEIGLGTITWGTAVPEIDAHRQLDVSKDAGVNLVDNAELYPAYPSNNGLSGEAERILGKWISRGGGRSSLIISTKVAGVGYPDIRNGKPISGQAIEAALEGSLSRMKTDYVDILQVHWPNRDTYHFRRMWVFDPRKQAPEVTLRNFEDILNVVHRLRERGKIREYGLSNETCWGTMKQLSLARARGTAPPVSIQNEYNLLNRHFDVDFAEVSYNERLPLLGYAPLAAGLLTGKYSDPLFLSGSRRAISQTLSHRLTGRALEAAAGYARLAREFQLDAAELAIAFCLSRPFVASVLTSASKIQQLHGTFRATQTRLTAEIFRRIETLHQADPFPY